MIPEFPQFKRLAREDNDAVEAHTRLFPYYSDYNFSSLWSWDIERKREISLLNGNLVVKFTDYETGEPFLSFLGIHYTVETAKILLDYSESIGLPPVLRLMPEISVFNIETPELNITPDKDQFDYIYLASRLSTLEGNLYKSKRQAANSFERSTTNHEFYVLPLHDTYAQEAVRSIALEWKMRKAPVADDQSIDHEIEAIENIFSLASVRDLLVGIVAVDGVPTSFTLEEISNQIMSIAHFWKTARRSEGEYEFLAREMARHVERREVTYLNWEQDLGVELLRASKSSYRPSDFLKKFIVTRTTD